LQSGTEPSLLGLDEAEQLHGLASSMEAKASAAPAEWSIIISHGHSALFSYKWFSVL
jgi:hypothetical protein